MQKDTVFQTDEIQIFEFNQAIANVFDDMLLRSIPFYKEVIALSIEFLKHFIKELNAKGKECVVYDLGSSTGNFLFECERIFKLEGLRAKLIGIDNSSAMVQKARLKAKSLESNIEFLELDLKDITFQTKDTNFIISHYTLQFLSPAIRKDVVKKICLALSKDSIFLMGEKIKSNDLNLDSLLTKKYYEYKEKQGYSKAEIYRKKEALENILIPFSVEENETMLKEAGFRHVEILFKWLNFTLFLSTK
ncbi:carboxy-S-adenosyl-L-methionine synthase CmoA [Helicobacter sp. 13S00401-1]|uniref:carboxy-S-adenosyl-L-methionine synthase CmoA n=1 Tax=Helicobacter sp. 13S00401-1 TaxID=1905758 RepID=UPI000BA5EAA8|nr:carboxy-S-adenosyl-L-methionine synthase CmoA [Helicobacter sp. 13S00401-1]PAF49675.1 carboxy-S-adenosyl-L-methionine synthase CmoA [Helicobacter sp. 13S00401-1]